MPDPLITLSGHTEGPWRVQRFGEENEAYIFPESLSLHDAYPDGEVAFIWGDENSGWIENEENARLIAAAPDLLAIATELHRIAMEGDIVLDEDVEAIWTSRGLAPPATEGARG